MSLVDEIKKQFSSGSNLMKLIYINSAVFLFIAVLKMFAFLFQTPEITERVLGFLAVPAATEDLIRRPWTIVSYMFLHEGFIHILFNMLWLAWFGRIFLQYFDHRKLVNLYVLGGLAGAVLFILPIHAPISLPDFSW